MAPKTWATRSQEAFLKEEDNKWALIKHGGTTLKSFYARTTTTFLSKWPVTPSAKILAEVGGDEDKAQELAEKKLLNVSVLACARSVLSHFVW